MGQLGDVLEVLFGPDDRFQTVRATIRQWHRRDLARKADLPARVMSVRKEDDLGKESDPKASTTILTIWVSRPACARIEKRRDEADGVVTGLTVTDGDRRWECDAEGHVEVSEGSSGSRMAPRLGTFDIEIDRHFSPGQIRLFFQELSLEPLGPIQVAGRDCARLRAVLRPGARLWPHWLPREATSYEFHVDVERGVLLSIISRRADQVFDVCEVIDVTFDEPLESSLFKYEPAPGEQVGPKIPVVEHLTLAAAVARMPFKVLVPTRLPDPDHSPVDVMYHPPRRHQRWPHLALMYRGSESYKFLSINESASADPNINELDWELVPNDKAFQKNLRVANPHQLGGMRIAAFEQEGTHVTIVSDLGQEELITLAMSPIPAPTGTLI